MRKTVVALLVVGIAACDDAPRADGDPDAAAADARTPDAEAPDARVGADGAPDARAEADARVEADARAESDARAEADARVETDARAEADAASDMGEITPDSGAPDAAAAWDQGVALPGNPLSPRQPNLGCRLPDVPLGDLELAEVFPALDFDRPLWVGAAPGEPGTLYVAEQGGRVWSFDARDDVAERHEFLRLAVNRAGNEEGLLGLAFHPRYAENGRLFVYYTGTRDTCPGGAGRCSVVAERRRGEPEERRLLVFPQPYSNHNGGDLQFGPDGHLYIASGDGGSGGDPLRQGQDTFSTLGKILRIDVDAAPARPAEPPAERCDDSCRSMADGECDDGAQDAQFDVCLYGTDCADCGPRPNPDAGPPRYAIPPGNPFADGLEGRPEVYAWGLRNPWRMRFDAVTGALWVGDVGQDREEEVDKITAPGNFGWNVREGMRCYRAQECAREGLIDPVWSYGHDQGQSITGGLVYRGADLPELWGAYLFADYGSGRVWALRERPDAPPDVRLLTQGAQITSFGEDAAGRVLLTSFGARRSLLTLRRREPAEAPPLPQLLSETGCFADTAAHRVAPGVVPFDVNVPLWSDGADKARFIALPPGTRATFRADGAWELPVGTVLLKTFIRDGRRLETRLITRGASGWHGYTWRWNAEQTDAELLDGALDADDWHFPSPAECDRCHTPAAGFTLGWRTSQLARASSLDGVDYDQVAALAAAGYVDGVPDGPLVAHPRPDDDAAPLADRARALLEANCAMCHAPGGPANARLDLRAATPLAETGLCDAPGQGDLGLAGARIVTPGDPERSVLHARMTRRGEGQMPPLATLRVDEAGADLVRRWIASLPSCP